METRFIHWLNIQVKKVITHYGLEIWKSESLTPPTLLSLKECQRNVSYKNFRSI